MHYTGMAAFEIGGWIVWNPVLVAASIALGALLGAPALKVGLHGDSIKYRIFGALLLTAAICSHHFTAMGAVSIVPDSSISVSESALPPTWLAIAVALASFAIIVLALAGLALDVRDRRRAELEADRMRGLANAAVEGLVVCDGDRVTTVNNSLAALAGCKVDDRVGAKLETYFPDEATRLKLLGRPNQPIEAGLQHSDGITGILGPNQMMARLGGDEFAIILPDVAHASSAGRIAEKILEVLRKENEISATAALVSASIGISVSPDAAAPVSVRPRFVA